MNKDLKRSKYGIGKLIFNNLYVHRIYVDLITDDLIRSNIQIAMKLTKINYDVIRYDISNTVTTFIKVNDFDSSQEPLPDLYTTYANNKVKTTKGQQIWHHKWMMVGDDYHGFDVEESKKRSELWTETMKHVDYKRIGRPDYWDKKLIEYKLSARK